MAARANVVFPAVVARPGPNTALVKTALRRNLAHLYLGLLLRVEKCESTRSLVLSLGLWRLRALLLRVVG